MRWATIPWRDRLRGDIKWNSRTDGERAFVATRRTRSATAVLRGAARRTRIATTVLRGAARRTRIATAVLRVAARRTRIATAASRDEPVYQTICPTRHAQQT